MCRQQSEGLVKNKKHLNRSWRESWDTIDSAFLKLDLKLDELVSLMGISENEYFSIRSKDSPPPEGALEKIEQLLQEIDTSK
tara:strand:+ start:4349 stop:4594 length:246 start_codon:yes stop_codon:yes gene_type:complete